MTTLDEHWTSSFHIPANSTLHHSTLQCLSPKQPQICPTERGKLFCKPKMPVKHVSQAADNTFGSFHPPHQSSTCHPHIRKTTTLTHAPATGPRYLLSVYLSLNTADVQNNISCTAQATNDLHSFLTPSSVQNTVQAHPRWRRCARKYYSAVFVF